MALLVFSKNRDDQMYQSTKVGKTVTTTVNTTLIKLDDKSEMGKFFPQHGKHLTNFY